MPLNRQHSIKLPVELWLLILCLLTTTDMAAFRSCCVEFNATLAMNTSTILVRLLENDDVQAVCALYGPLGSASSPAFLIRCLGRCQTVEALSQAIGSHFVKKDPVMRKAVAKNIKPYVLALGHFFEEYRSGLASHVNSDLYRGYNPEFADRLEYQILQAYFNRETMQRMRLTHNLVNRILIQRFFGRGGNDLWQDLDTLCPVFDIPHDIYTFGGLELVTDIVTRVRSVDSPIATHLVKMTTAHGEVDGLMALPSSVLGLRLSWDTTLRIRDLFPFARARCFFSLKGPTSRYPPPDTHDKAEVLNRDFLDDLKSYRGTGPELMKPGVVLAGARLSILRAAMAGDGLVVYPDIDSTRTRARPYYQLWWQYKADSAK